MDKVIDRITKTMEVKKITARNLCKNIGIGETNFVQWKKGKEGYKKHLPKIAETLNVSVEYLTTGKESEAEEWYSKFKTSPEYIQEAIKILIEKKK